MVPRLKRVRFLRSFFTPLFLFLVLASNPPAVLQWTVGGTVWEKMNEFANNEHGLWRFCGLCRFFFFLSKVPRRYGLFSNSIKPWKLDYCSLSHILDYNNEIKTESRVYWKGCFITGHTGCGVGGMWLGADILLQYQVVSNSIPKGWLQSIPFCIPLLLPPRPQATPGRLLHLWQALPRPGDFTLLWGDPLTNFLLQTFKASFTLWTLPWWFNSQRNSLNFRTQFHPI